MLRYDLKMVRSCQPARGAARSLLCVAGLTVTVAGAAPWRPVGRLVSVALLAVSAAPGGGYVAVGESGVIVVSGDGESWHVAKSPTQVTLRGVTCGPPGWVAVGDGGVILTSPDAELWLRRDSGSTGRLNAVTWTGGRFVAVGVAGGEVLSGGILVSEDGVRWRNRTPAGVRPLYGVAGDGSQVMAVGWTGTAAESLDGETWSVTSLGEVLQGCWFMLRPSFLYAVAASLHTWVTVGLVVGDQYPGAGVSLARQGGGKWSCSVTELPPLQFKFRGLAATDSSFLAAGQGGIAESRDGLRWTPQWEEAAAQLYGIAVGRDGAVAVGEGGRILVRDRATQRPARRVVRSGGR